MVKRIIRTAIAIALICAVEACDKTVVSDPTIGAVLPLSGTSSAQGQAARNAIELAVGEFNEAGGLNGKSLSLIVYDNAGDTAKTYLAVNKLAEKDQVIGIIGPLDENATIAVTPLIDEMALPLIALSGECNPPRQVSPYVYRLTPEPAALARTLARKLAATNIERAALIYSQDQCGEIGKTELAEKQQATIEWIVSEAVDGSANVISEALTKAAAARAEVTVIWTPAAIAGSIIRVLAERQLNLAIFLIPDAGRVEPSALALVPNNSVTSLLSQVSHYDMLNSEQLDARGIARFNAGYENKYKSPPAQVSFLAYDAARMMIESIARAGTERMAANKSLQSTSAFHGLAGDYSFSLEKKYGLDADSLVEVENIDGRFAPETEPPGQQ